MAFKIPLIRTKSLSKGYFEGLPNFVWGDNRMDRLLIRKSVIILLSALISIFYLPIRSCSLGKNYCSI